MARSGQHYMPRPDGNFAAWVNQYCDAVEKFYGVQGFDPIGLADLKEALEMWNALYPEHVKAQAAAQGARQAKDAARAALEKEVRHVTNFVQGYPKTSDADRATIGITLRNTARTRVGGPSSRPLALVESGQRLTHQLRLVDESTPNRRARPRGIERAEVFVALTAPGQPAPSDPREYRYIGSVKRGETTLRFETNKGGMQAHYLSRWVSTSGATGPWSDTASATVAA